MATTPDPSLPLDHFITRDGVRFAGMHLLVDLWGGEKLDDLDHTERALTDAVRAAGATLLHTHLHHFSPNGGISGVLVLAESHISIHTWPERGYAALDIFMCGDADPYRAIPVLRAAFRPATVTLSENKRGLIQ
jgi:S-adenosylmethionine decarboxylase